MSRDIELLQWKAKESSFLYIFMHTNIFRREENSFRMGVPLLMFNLSKNKINQYITVNAKDTAPSNLNLLQIETIKKNPATLKFNNILFIQLRFFCVWLRGFYGAFTMVYHVFMKILCRVLQQPKYIYCGKY